jgi:hypothetical protein
LELKSLVAPNRERKNTQEVDLKPDGIPRRSPLAAVITLKWVWDLCEPNEPGIQFSRYGHRVFISEENFEAAQRELGAGAKEVVFEARRDDGHYILEFHTAIK